MKLDKFKNKVMDSNRENNNGVLAWNTNKQKNTCIEKYGVDNPWKNKSIRNKCKDTAIKRYGTSNNYSKALQTIKQTYGSVSYLRFKNREYQRDILLNKDKFEKFIEERYNSKSSAKNIYKDLKITHSVFFRYLNKYNLKDKFQFAHIVSLEELELKDEIEKLLNIKTISSFKINRLEIDIYIPDFSIGIEFNGVAWHDKNKYLKDISNKTSFSREQQKVDYFKKYGIDIINVWEDDWNNDRNSILNNIKNVLDLKGVVKSEGKSSK